MNKHNLFLILLCFAYCILSGQSTWEVVAKDIRPENYYGVTLANGMIGIISSLIR